MLESTDFPKKLSFENFFMTRNLEDRRQYYTSIDPNFLKLEEILFSKYPKIKDQRLIYMPEMLEANFYMEESLFIKLKTRPDMQLVRQCHSGSYDIVKTAPKEAKAVLFHGFYMIENLWRLHSWFGHQANYKDSFLYKYEYIDVTGNESTMAYGRPVDLETFEKRILS